MCDDAYLVENLACYRVFRIAFFSNEIRRSPEGVNIAFYQYGILGIECFPNFRTHFLKMWQIVAREVTPQTSNTSAIFDHNDRGNDRKADFYWHEKINL